MLLGRIFGLLVAVALGGCVLLYLGSGERRYLSLAWRIFRIALFAFVLVLLLIFAERLTSQF